MRARSAALTPALARERARMGAIRARAAAWARASARSDRERALPGMGALGGPPTTSTTTAALQGSLRPVAAAQAEIKTATGVDVDQQSGRREGRELGVRLTRTATTPRRPSDNANSFTSSPAAFASCPASGLFSAPRSRACGVGNIIACPLANAFASIGFGLPSPACGGKVCSTSGNWTAADVLQDSGLRRAAKHAEGELRAFVLPDAA